MSDEAEEQYRFLIALRKRLMQTCAIRSPALLLAVLEEKGLWAEYEQKTGKAAKEPLPGAAVSRRPRKKAAKKAGETEPGPHI